ncbi:MAG: GAF domain-containing protein, partial [Caldilineaceae bacterium]|nr:GAF domain-containing protein [Caldilineaceae bacterium]
MALQCRRVPGVLGGVVLTRSEGEHATYLPAAVWPDNGRNMMHLSAAAERALRERSGVLLPQLGAQGQPTSFHIAYPIEVSGDIYGVAVLEVGPQPEARLQEVLRSLHWGIAWLVDLFRQLRNEREERLTKRVMSVLDTIAATVEANGFQHAATTFATEFSDRLGCDRVAVGFSKRGHAEVRAISHSAHFKQEANLVRAIGEAMDEALDQKAAIVYPELAASDQTVIARATRELAELHGADAVAIIPFHVGGDWRGAISLERCNGEPFSRADIELAQGTVALAGPMLESLRRNDLPLPQKAMESARTVADVFVGPKHLGWKL